MRRKGKASLAEPLQQDLLVHEGRIAGAQITESRFSSNGNAAIHLTDGSDPGDVSEPVDVRITGHVDPFTLHAESHSRRMIAGGEPEGISGHLIHRPGAKNFVNYSAETPSRSCPRCRFEAFLFTTTCPRCGEVLSS